jgi:hypothetical protein
MRWIPYKKGERNCESSKGYTHTLGLPASHSPPITQFPDVADLLEIVLEWIDAEDHEEVIDNDVMEAFFKKLERVTEPEDSDSNDNVMHKSNNVIDKRDEEDNEDEEPLISSFQAMSDVNEFPRYARSVGFIEADNFLLDRG